MQVITPESNYVEASILALQTSKSDAIHLPSVSLKDAIILVVWAAEVPRWPKKTEPVRKIETWTRTCKAKPIPFENRKS